MRPTEILKNSNLFSKGDLFTASQIYQIEKETYRDKLSILSAFLSKHLAEGHTCLPLEVLYNTPLYLDDESTVRYEPPSAEELTVLSKKSNCLGIPGEYKPLLLTSKQIYFHRCYHDELSVIEKLKTIALYNNPPLSSSDKTLDANLHSASSHPSSSPTLLDLFFPATLDGSNHQRFAVEKAMNSRLTILSGGPGTGKTTTMSKMLYLLLEKEPDLQIALAAPTGKAAARMNQAVSQAVSGMKANLEIAPFLDDAKIEAILANEGVTVHRLLGYHGAKGFTFHKENTLPYDLIIIDESSMLALDLIAALLEAISKDARLILLGDRNQLASVEAGTVYSDLCLAGEKDTFLKNSITELKESYRFKAYPGIGELAKLVNKGTETNFDLYKKLFEKYSSEISFHEITHKEEIARAIAPSILEGFRDYCKSKSPEEYLKSIDKYKILCALKQGPYGIHAINILCEDVLKEGNLLESTKGNYNGKPILILANDYTLQLFNGDSGVFFEGLAWFLDAHGELRSFSPAMLPTFTTAYAITIHKSQGSEYEKTTILLPEGDNRIVTKELIYTAITRAKSCVEIYCAPQVFVGGAQRKIERASGLVDHI